MPEPIDITTARGATGGAARVAVDLPGAGTPGTGALATGARARVHRTGRAGPIRLVPLRRLAV